MPANRDAQLNDDQRHQGHSHTVGERKLIVLDRLPKPLSDAAYKSGIELAWARANALAVVDHVTQNQIVVSRIEIWLPTIPGPTIPMPNLYFWDAPKQGSGESWTRYVTRANAEARLYIANFEWDKSDTQYLHHEPCFNLTGSDASSPG